MPIGEDAERYRLEILPAAGMARVIELTGPGYDYEPGAQAVDGIGATTTILFRVTQIGTQALSPPATFTL